MAVEIFSGDCSGHWLLLRLVNLLRVGNPRAHRKAPASPSVTPKRVLHPAPLPDRPFPPIYTGTICL